MISPTDLFHPSPAPHFKTFQVFMIYCPKALNMEAEISLATAALINELYKGKGSPKIYRCRHRREA
jgi:hypothetical protein